MQQCKPLSRLQVDLMEAVKVSLFDAVARLLYGRQFVDAHGCSALRAAFFTFEDAFELAASPLPHIFQPRFRRARSTLLSAFRCANSISQWEACKNSHAFDFSTHI